MNRRTAVKGALTTLAVVSVGGPTVLLQSACGDTKQIVRWLGTVRVALTDMRPLLPASIAAAIDRALPVVDRLEKALKQNDHASTLDLLNDLINPATGIIVDIARLVGQLPEGAPTTKLVLGLLAIAQVALRLVAANISDAPADAQAAARRSKPEAARSVGLAADAGKLKTAFEATKF